MMHNEYMSKNAAITIRLPVSLKRRLEARARQNRRSLSAQVVTDLETILESTARQQTKGTFLGAQAGSRVPSEDDLNEVRSMLWGRLPTGSPTES